MSTARATYRSQEFVRFSGPSVPLRLISGEHASSAPHPTELEEHMMTDIRERLARVEAGLLHLATKNDLATLESTLLKWFIGTALALSSFVFAAAKIAA
jgi:hypothetical protein